MNTPLRIGTAGWVTILKELTEPLDPDYWAAFRPVPAAELTKLEQAMQRKLPDEFVEFYRTVGCGKFPSAGAFYSPADIEACLSVPIYYMLGSLSQGKEWCTEEEHDRLWLTRGAFNPAPDKFTKEALTSNGVPLYDLLTFGYDCGGALYNIYVGPPRSPLGFCILYSQEIEATYPSLSVGIETMIQSKLEFQEEIPDDDPEVLADPEVKAALEEEAACRAEVEKLMKEWRQQVIRAGLDPDTLPDPMQRPLAATRALVLKNVRNWLGRRLALRGRATE